MDTFDDGDFDDDFDDLALLEQAEAQALAQHAAIQATEARVQPEAAVTQASPQVDHGQAGLHSEMARLQKLHRDLQGELLVLKANHARAKTDQETQLARVTAARLQAEEETQRKVLALQEENQRLNHAMTFQRQELRDARSKQAQMSPGKLSPSAKRAAMEFPPLAEVSLRHSPSKKRKRSRKSGLDEEMDFDRVQVGSKPMSAAATVQAPQMAMEAPSMSRAATPTPSFAPDVSMHDDMPMLVESVAEPVDTKLSDKLHLCTWLSSLKTQEGHSLLHDLDDDAAVGQHGSLMTILINHEHYACDVEMAFALVDALTKLAQSHNAKRTGVVRVLLLLLREFPTTLAQYIISHEEDLGLLKLLADGFWTQSAELLDLHPRRLTMLLHIACHLGHEIQPCQIMLSALDAAFWSHALNKQRPDHEFSTAVQLLANLAHAEATIANDTALLDLVTQPLEPQLGTASLKHLTKQTVALQWLYAVSIYQSNALEVLRSNRLLVPRLGRCIYRQLDTFYMDTTKRPLLNSFAEMCLRLYHLLLNGMDAAQAERHWQHPQTKATHVVAMTRISFAEDEDAFGLEMIDMARDLLELCISPEEGEEIHAILS